jgi:hypothetical protein
MWHELDPEALAREEHAIAPPRSLDEVEQIVALARLELYNRNQSYGVAALRRRLQDHYNLRPLPSRHRIKQILVRQGLTHRRTGWYEGEELDWLPTSSGVPREERR